MEEMTAGVYLLIRRCPRPKIDQNNDAAENGNQQRAHSEDFQVTVGRKMSARTLSRSSLSNRIKLLDAMFEDMGLRMRLRR